MRGLQVWITCVGASVALGPICGCCGDAAGPGARGKIRLGAGVEVAKFASLEIRTYPDSEPSFDVTRPLPAGAGSELYLSRQSLDAISFPYGYEVGRNVYGTERPRWRVVAWLSKDSPSSAIAPGDAYGTKSYDVPDCGSCGGYCGKTDGVDVTLDAVAP